MQHGLARHHSPLSLPSTHIGVNTANHPRQQQRQHSLQPALQSQARQLHLQQQQRSGRDCTVFAASVPELLTPHSGYHFDGSNRRFFEGWYFKVWFRFAHQHDVAMPLGNARACQASQPAASQVVHNPQGHIAYMAIFRLDSLATQEACCQASTAQHAAAQPHICACLALCAGDHP